MYWYLHITLCLCGDHSFSFSGVQYVVAPNEHFPDVSFALPINPLFSVDQL